MGLAPADHDKAHAATTARRTLTFALVAIVPVLVAFAVEAVFRSSITRWLVFNAAVIVSAWAGGFASGILATMLSAAIVLWYFVPPGASAGVSGSTHLASAILFVAIGMAVSMFLGRLKRAKQNATRDMSALTQAQTELEAANRRLQDTAKELSESKGLLQAVFDYSPNAIVVKDLDGKFMLTNRQFELFFGRSAQELRGKTDSDVLPHPTDVERHKSADAKAVATGRPVTIEESGELADGTHTFLETVFPLRDGREHPFGVGWIGTEITEMKRAEEALRRTAADLKEAQRVGHIGSWKWDLKTDVVAWSEELCRIHGREPSVAPKTFQEAFLKLFTPDSMRTLKAAIDKFMTDRKPYELELETIMADGSNRWIAVRGEAVWDAAGQLVAVRGTSQDITQLKHLQRMKEEWMSVVAHDLRQPIGVIKMAAELLPDLHVGEISAEEKDITGRICSAANGLARMVDDLLDMSRIEARRLSLERVWADTTDAVRKTVAALAHVTGGCPVRVSQEGEPTQIFIDPMRFDQILGNLISNAVKYGEKNGEIEVRATVRAGETEIAVTNRGAGIPPEELPRLFTRFGRSSTTRGSGVTGLGLGLYIAKGLAEAHGGRMWADSVPGATTTFHFTLPSRAAAKEAA